MKSIKPLLLLSSALLTLASCSNQDQGQTSSEETPSSSVDGTSSSDVTSSTTTSEQSWEITSQTRVSGIADAMAKLNSSTRYIVTVTLTDAEGNEGLSHDIYFNPYYYYFAGTTEYGYAIQTSLSNNVFSLSRPEADGDIVNGQRVKDSNGEYYDNLWASGLFTSMRDLYEAGSDVWTAETSMDLSANKLVKLSFVKLLGYSANYYTSINSLTFSVGETLGTWSALIQIGTSRYYKVGVADVGIAQNDEIQDLLDAGTDYLVADANITRIAELFQANNFKRRVISYEDNETEEGTEYYLPDYWYYHAVQGLDSGYGYGVMGIANKYYNGTLLNGTYMFTASSTAVSLVTTGVYNRSSNVPEDVLVYPGYMTLWDNLEYVSAGTGEVDFTVSDQTILRDFASNNQVLSTIEEAEATMLRLDIVVEEADEDEKVVVDFYLYYNYGGSVNSYRFEFYDFGAANISSVDSFIATSLSDTAA